MAYKVFERRRTRTEEPSLSIHTHGRLALNAAATRLLKAAGVQAVKVLWDTETRGIALQAASKAEENAYSISFSRGRSASISVKAFLPYIGWSAIRKQTIPATWNPDRNMLEAELPSRFVGRSAEHIEEASRPAGALSRSPGASGNIRNWMARNESVPKK